MGLIDFFRRSEPSQARVEPSLQAASSVESTTQWSNGFITPGMATAGVRVDESTVIGLPGTLQALRVLCGVFAMTPLVYYRRDGEGRTPARGNILYDLLRVAANGHQSAFHFRELMMGDILLAGEFNAYVSRDRLGRPVALTRLRPGTCTPALYFSAAEGETVFYDATLPDGHSARFSGRDILHIVGLSRDGLNGMNPIRYAREALGGAIATERHAQRFWARGGKVDTVLQGKGRISRENKAVMREDWARLYGNPEATNVAVLDQDVTAQFLNSDHQKQQFLETRGYQLGDLARIWGVPPHLIFDLSKATFSNIEQQSLEFLTYHLGPHFERVSSAITMRLAEADHFAEHLTDALVKGDLKSRMEAYWLQRQMGMVSADELRQRDNIKPIGGAAGTTYWRPGNMVDAAEPVPGTP
ncbi:phage portal protein [Pararhodobacter zhoushanensis]|uniref:phage portal protein n=1 Tax=Pararhodobacter zhoushanensis TaxID=2479545 RepID=UPI000F8CD9D4|nr:phage portal protein [Pararhodobacter zhoushanensis]